MQPYHQSAATLNLLRAFTKGGFADLTQVHMWNQEFVASVAGRSALRDDRDRDRAGARLHAARRGSTSSARRSCTRSTSGRATRASCSTTRRALTRRDSLTGDWYDCSAHMLWIGERTRQPDGAHVEFFAGVHNPLGVKLGPGATAEEALELCERLNPSRIPGRLTFIVRMGAERVAEALPPLLRAVREAEHPVVWACDPMHANIFRTARGSRRAASTRSWPRSRRFFAACRAEETWPGGVHLEFTGEDVTECLGGSAAVLEEELDGALRDALRPAPERTPVARPRVPRGRADAELSSMPPLRTLAVVGTGLIGASVGLAARRAGVERVTGWDPDADHLATAAQSAAPSMPARISRSALARGRARRRRGAGDGAARLRSAPSSTRAGRSCTVTDVGSTKGAVCVAASGERRFVGGHPICGSEARGPERATGELFEGATWFLTPVAATDPERYKLLHGFVSALGATPVAVDPEAHDRLVAVTSHLPHALANVLLNQAGAARIEGHEPLATAGGSLRDMTRIAGANPRIWVDIFLENREALGAALAEHRRRIEQVEAALAAGDAGFLARWIGEAAGEPPAAARDRVRRRGRAPAAARPHARPARA